MLDFDAAFAVDGMTVDVQMDCSQTDLPTDFGGNTGPPGKTPDISITAHAVPHTAPPTVSKAGDIYVPLFDLGIPEGKPGSDAAVEAMTNTDIDALFKNI